MKPNPCPLCGVDMSVWGRMHTCRPPSTADTSASAEHVANAGSVIEHLANRPGRNRASTTYRYRNPTKRRLYMRNLMRQRRATGRAA